MNQSIRHVLPFLFIPVLILAAALIGLPASDATPVAQAQDDAPADGDEVVVTVEVTREVTREVTVIVTPTFTPLPPTPTPLSPEDTVDDDPYLGSADAPVKVVEFSDYQCGFCARFYDDTLVPLTEHYGDLIQFVYRDYPIFGDPSVYGAMGAECAGEQGQFWAYHNAIFDNSLQEQPLPLNVETYELWARELELDVDAWNACMESDATLEEIRIDATDGQAWGVTGTPTFFINGRKFVGAQPFATFLQVIDEELIAAGIEPPPPPSTE